MFQNFFDTANLISTDPVLLNKFLNYFENIHKQKVFTCSDDNLTTKASAALLKRFGPKLIKLIGAFYRKCR